MKLNISDSKITVVVFLFLAVYFYCNILSQMIYNSNSSIFIITKIISLFYSVIFFLLLDKKNYINNHSKKWLLFYLLFILVCLFSAIFSKDQYISLRAIFINFTITLPLLIFHFYIDSERKFKIMIRLITIFYLLFSSVIIYNEFYTNSLSRSFIGGYPKGGVVNLVILGLSLFVIEKKLFKLLIITLSILLIYFSLSVKLLLLLIIFFISILLINKKNLMLFLFFFVLFYIFLSNSLFHNLLNNIEIYFPEYYNIVYQRFLALFGHQDLSNYAINDVNNNISLRMESLKLFFNNQIFGIGLENERTTIGTQAHSGLISILIGTGIIGFIFFYFFIFYILFLSFKYEYDDVIIISIIYVFFSLINPVHNNSPAVIVLFLASSLFILKRKKILT